MLKLTQGSFHEVKGHIVDIDGKFQLTKGESDKVKTAIRCECCFWFKQRTKTKIITRLVLNIRKGTGFILL